MNYAILASCPLLLNDAFYRKIWMFSATQPKENEEATISPLAMVHGRHHGPTVVSAGADFLLFPCFRGIAAYGVRGGCQNTSNKGQM